MTVLSIVVIKALHPLAALLQTQRFLPVVALLLLRVKYRYCPCCNIVLPVRDDVTNSKEPVMILKKLKYTLSRVSALNLNSIDLIIRKTIYLQVKIAKKRRRKTNSMSIEDWHGWVSSVGNMCG